MKGLTLYLDVISPARKWATDEEFGRLCKLALDAAEEEKIPEVTNERDALLFEGFIHCLNQGINCVNKKRNGVNNRWKKEKESGDFDTTVSCYTPTQIVEKRSMNNEVDNNNLQLLLATLEETKPQTNQTINLLYWNNSKVRECIDVNKINKATQELAWKLYTSNNKN